MAYIRIFVDWYYLFKKYQTDDEVVLPERAQCDQWRDVETGMDEDVAQERRENRERIRGLLIGKIEKRDKLNTVIVLKRNEHGENGSWRVNGGGL